MSKKRETITVNLKLKKSIAWKMAERILKRLLGEKKETETIMASPKVFFNNPDDFLNLKDNWDGYGAPVISIMAIKNCKALVAGIQYVPTNRGGVQIEITYGGIEVEIELNKKGNVCGILTSSDMEY